MKIKTKMSKSELQPPAPPLESARAAAVRSLLTRRICVHSQYTLGVYPQ